MIKEGKTRKGGVNSKPTNEKPNIKSAGQKICVTDDKYSICDFNHNIIKRICKNCKLIEKLNLKWKKQND